MSLTKISTKGSPLSCAEMDANLDYLLDLANATGQLDCSKISQTSLSTCLSANSVIVGIQTSINSNATAIGQVSQDLNDAQTTLQNNINSLTTLVGNQNTTIADLTVQIGNLTAAFNSLDGTVAAFNSRLLSIEGRLVSLEQAIASGIILIWSGTILTIPSQYSLCNGTNGTPDLRDRFIVGAGSSYAINTIGGAVNHVHTSTATTGGTSLTIAQMPAHNHDFVDLGHNHVAIEGIRAVNLYTSGPNGGEFTTGSYSNQPPNLIFSGRAFSGVTVQSQGANEAHTHTMSSSTSSASSIPPYYALAYIMKT